MLLPKLSCDFARDFLIMTRHSCSPRGGGNRQSIGGKNYATHQVNELGKTNRQFGVGIPGSDHVRNRVSSAEADRAESGGA